MSTANNKSPISELEYVVLSFLKSRTENPEEESMTEVAEIASLTGIRDRDEVLRALYTLEGKSLVRPEPAGDFTSSHWLVTETGLKAQSIVAAQLGAVEDVARQLVANG